MASSADIQPPSWGWLQEPFGVAELPRLLWRLPELTRQPRGAGEPVMVLPGFGTGDASTGALRSYLGWLGYRVQGWGLGTNRGDVPALIPQVAERVAELAAAARQRVRLVGWSLGGVLAREVARDDPERVARVMTLGTPAVGGPKYTAAGRIYALRGFDLDAIEAEAEQRNRIPIRVPVTAIYSRRDGVVAWRACFDPFGADIEYVEVRATHLGLGFSPEVYRLVAQRLAEDD